MFHGYENTDWAHDPENDVPSKGLCGFINNSKERIVIRNADVVKFRVYP
jgi:hypothetical protein